MLVPVLSWRLKSGIMEKRIIITIKEEFLEKLEEIKDSLLNHKMTISEAHQFGVISGSIEEGDIQAVKSEPYIEAIEDDEEVRFKK